MSIEYRIGDVFDRMREIPDGSIDLLVTSPPFLALRSYLPADHPDKAKEIGSEPTPAEFLDTLYALSAEWGRVLAPHGSICVELGDTYAGTNNGANTERYRGYSGGRHNNDTNGSDGGGIRTGGGPGWPLAKSLTGIPTLYPWGLAYGRNLLTGQPHDAGQWRIRNLIVWARPNPPVGALGDKFRPATSYITVACKGQRRYFDLDAVRSVNDPERMDRTDAGSGFSPGLGSGKGNGSQNPAGAPPLDWHADDHPEDGDWLWKLSTQPYRGSHYATFPLTLPKRLIEAMCPLRVCTVCGKPSERVVEGVGGSLHDHSNDEHLGMNRPNPRPVNERFANNTTVGWTDCGCKEPTVWNRQHSQPSWSSTRRTDPEQMTASCGSSLMETGTSDSQRNGRHSPTSQPSNRWRTGIVLDPFAGSGTTLEAAQAVGRHAIGIDLDQRNATLARERVGMFMEVVEDAWTEADTPGATLLEVRSEGGR